MSYVRRDGVSVLEFILLFGAGIFLLAGADWFWESKKNQEFFYGLLQSFQKGFFVVVGVGIVSCVVLVLILQIPGSISDEDSCN